MAWKCRTEVRGGSETGAEPKGRGWPGGQRVWLPSASHPLWPVGPSPSTSTVGKNSRERNLEVKRISDPVRAA